MQKGRQTDRGLEMCDPPSGAFAGSKTAPAGCWKGYINACFNPITDPKQVKIEGSKQGICKYTE